MYQLPFSYLRKDYVVFVLFTICSVKVLAAVDQQKPDAAGQRWYEKGWRPTTSSDYADSSNAGGGRSQMKTGGDGSGAGPISDLDEGASGLGEDDEDADAEIGSGTGSSNSRFDVGSGGDISLPPTVRYPSSVSSTEAPSAETTIHSTTSARPSATSAIISTTEDVETTPLHPLRGTSGRHATSTEAVTTRMTTKTPKLFLTESTASLGRTTTESTLTTRPTPRASTSAAPKRERPSVLDDRNKSLPANFWMRPGVLAGLIGGAIAGLLAAILLVMFVVYRMRKKDEGSYALEEPKSTPTYAYAYQKAPTREFYA